MTSSRFFAIDTTTMPWEERFNDKIGRALFRKELFSDPETGMTLEVDTGDPAVREAFERQVGEERETRRRLLRRLAIDEVAVRTDQSYVEPLLRFFRLREARRGRR